MEGILLLEEPFQRVLEVERLLLFHRPVIVVVHILAVPEDLEHLPFLLDAQPLRHRIGQECRLRP